MQDIARLAGCSPGAASVALSGRKSSIGVSEKTRACVLEVAREHGYRPNRVARSLSDGKSYTIALLGRETYFVYALETIKGIEDVLRERDYSLLVYYDGARAEDQERHLSMALDRHADGLIVVGCPESPRGDNHRRIANLRKQGIPVVQIYRRIFPDVPVVMTDESAAGYAATRHLLELGHVRVAHVTHADYEDLAFPGEASGARKRAEGYAQAMRESGLEPRIVTYPSPAVGGVGYSELPAKVVTTLRRAKMTAATCFCDYTAIGLISAFRARGVRVPDDFSIVGYDNIEASRLTDPRLTTLGQPLRELGRAAAEAVFELSEGEKVADTILQPELQVRGSTSRANVDTNSQ